MSEDQIAVYKEEASSAISLGYTVAFPMGVLVIVVMISILPKLFRIDLEKEKEAYRKEIRDAGGTGAGKEQPLNFMIISLVAVIGIIVGGITIPLGSPGSFWLGTAGGVLLAALLLSYIGKIGPINFRMESKSLGIMYQMGLTFFMAVVGLRYGYDVVTSLMGSGLALAVSAVIVEAAAVFISFLIGRKLFGLNWIVLSGAIAGGCTSAPGLGAAISSTGSVICLSHKRCIFRRCLIIHRAGQEAEAPRFTRMMAEQNRIPGSRICLNAGLTAGHMRE